MIKDKDLENLLTGKTNDNDVAHNHGETSISTDLDDFGNSMNAYDMIFQTTVATNKEMSKKHKKKYFMGVVVTAEQISSFELEMATSPEYARQLCGNTIDNFDVQKLDQSIYMVRVYIPELHGFLPMLSKAQVQEYSEYKEDPPKAKVEDPKFNLYEKTLSRITPFYCSLPAPPSIDKVAKVEIADENTMFFGTFLSLVGAS